MARTPRSAVEETLEGIDPKATADLQAQIDSLKGDISEILATLKKLGSATMEAAEEEGAERLAALRARVGDAVDSARSRISDGLGEARARLDSGLGDARAKVADTRHDIEDYAQRKPVQAMGISAGIGLLIGLVLARR